MEMASEVKKNQYLNKEFNKKTSVGRSTSETKNSLFSLISPDFPDFRNPKH